MKNQFYQTMRVLRYIAQNGQIKVSRNLSDFVSDKFLQLANEPTLLSFVDKFATIMDASFEDMHPDLKGEIK